ncbi:MAG: glycosyl hydrolase family 17 protein [Myxococcota bacterium]
MGQLHGVGGQLIQGNFVGGRPLQGVGLPSEEIRARLRRLLEEGLHGLCFSAYAPGQSPVDHHQLSPEQVRERLAVIAPHTQWIRTFSCYEGNEHAPGIAKELGMKALVGAWLDGDEARNAEEIQAVIDQAKGGNADLIAVGNEVLLRGELPEDAIIDAIHRVKAGAPGVPVAYVDAYFQFVQHPRLVEACDYLPINCYPYWEQCKLDWSVGYVEEMVRRVAAVANGKEIVIAETGWPTQGTPEGEAVPGVDNAALYALNLIPWAKQVNVPLFWFSAFDEAWKVGAEGDCGAYWGIWDAEAQPKF